MINNLLGIADPFVENHLYSIVMHYHSSTSQRHLLKLTTGGEHFAKYRYDNYIEAPPEALIGNYEN